MAINLLPWREQIIAQRTRLYGLLLLASIIIISLFAVGMHYYLKFIKNNYQSRNLFLTQEINNIRVPDNLKELSDDYQIASQQIKLIQATRFNQRNFWREFTFLQQNLPEEIQITHLAWIGKELQIQGTTVRAENIGSLVKSLEINPLFSQILLDNIGKEDHESTIHFSIQMSLTQEPTA